MSKESIILLLSKRKNKWFSTKEIATILNLNISGVTHTLERMRHYGEVYYKSEGQYFLYKYR